MPEVGEVRSANGETRSWNGQGWVRTQGSAPAPSAPSTVSRVDPNETDNPWLARLKGFVKGATTYMPEALATGGGMLFGPGGAAAGSALGEAAQVATGNENAPTSFGGAVMKPAMEGLLAAAPGLAMRATKIPGAALEVASHIPYIGKPIKLARMALSGLEAAGGGAAPAAEDAAAQTADELGNTWSKWQKAKVSPSYEPPAAAPRSVNTGTASDIGKIPEGTTDFRIPESAPEPAPTPPPQSRSTGTGFNIGRVPEGTTSFSMGAPAETPSMEGLATAAGKSPQQLLNEEAIAARRAKAVQPIESALTPAEESAAQEYDLTDALNSLGDTTDPLHQLLNSDTFRALGAGRPAVKPYLKP